MFGTNMLKKGLVLGAMVVAAGLMIAGCGSTASTQTQDQKPLVFAGEVTYPPFEFIDKDNKDHFVGFDVDLSHEIGKKIGRKVEYKSMGFDALIPALQSKQIDAIASGIVETPERDKVVSFSNSYAESKNVIVVKKSDDSIKGLADIKGKTGGAQIGTTAGELIKSQPGTTLKDYDMITTMLQSLQKGDIQFAVLDKPVAEYYISKAGLSDLKVVDAGQQELKVAIAVNKNDKELLDQINKAIAELKADGTMKKLEDKWFGAASK